MQGAFPPPTGAESTWSLVEEDVLYMNRAPTTSSKRPSQSGNRAGGPPAGDAALDSTSSDAALFDSNSSLKYRYFAIRNSIIIGILERPEPSLANGIHSTVLYFTRRTVLYKTYGTRTYSIHNICTLILTMIRVY